MAIKGLQQNYYVDRDELVATQLASEGLKAWEKIKSPDEHKLPSIYSYIRDKVEAIEHTDQIETYVARVVRDWRADSRSRSPVPQPWTNLHTAIMNNMFRLQRSKLDWDAKMRMRAWTSEHPPADKPPELDQLQRAVNWLRGLDAHGIAMYRQLTIAYMRSGADINEPEFMAWRGNLIATTRDLNFERAEIVKKNIAYDTQFKAMNHNSSYDPRESTRTDFANTWLTHFQVILTFQILRNQTTEEGSAMMLLHHEYMGLSSTFWTGSWIHYPPEG